MNSKIQKIRINHPYPGMGSTPGMLLEVGLPLYQTEQFELLYKYVDALSETDLGWSFSEFTTRLLWFMKMPNDGYSPYFENIYIYNENRYDKWLNYLCSRELQYRKNDGMLSQHPENDFVIKEQQELEFLERFNVVHTVIYSENELTINPMNISFQYQDEKTGEPVIVETIEQLNEMAQFRENLKD